MRPKFIAHKKAYPLSAKVCNQLSLFDVPVTADDSSYLDGLLGDGAKTQVDVDVDAYELQLPPWYDDEKYKRYIDIYAPK